MVSKKLISDCSECALAKDCLPSGISNNQLHRFTGIVSTNISFQTGEVLFEQNVTANCLYVVKSGTFKTQTSTNQGEEHVNNFFLAGEIIGLDSASGGTTVNMAIALEPSMACKIQYRELTKLRQEFPSLSDFAIKIYGASLASANEIQNNVAIQCASSRLANFLLLYNKRSNMHGMPSLELHLPMTRHDIASHLGLAVETISRSFTKLIDLGCITKEARKVQIIDIDKLTKAAISPSR